MNKIVMGRLLGIEETKLVLETTAGRQVFPRQALDVSVEWTFRHLGQPVLCQLRDETVIGIEGLN